MAEIANAVSGVKFIVLTKDELNAIIIDAIGDLTFYEVEQRRNGECVLELSRTPWSNDIVERHELDTLRERIVREAVEDSA